MASPKYLYATLHVTKVNEASRNYVYICVQCSEMTAMYKCNMCCKDLVQCFISFIYILGFVW